MWKAGSKALAVSAPDPLAILPRVPGMRAFADLGLGEDSLINWNVVTTAGGNAALAAPCGNLAGRGSTDPPYPSRRVQASRLR